jgi:hypothetical protein
MRTFLAALALGALLWPGCARHRVGSAAGFTEVPVGNKFPVSLSTDKVIMTPETVLVGKVTRANQEGRFVIMTFPVGHLPVLNQRLSVYRQGLKVGEVRVTGPQLDDNVVGDIGAGEALSGDEVRGQ